MRLRTVIFCLTASVFALSAGSLSKARSADLPYTIVDTGQKACSTASSWIACPETGSRFHGQDAQYMGNEPAYADNEDGTITDLNTGLMWVKARGVKMTWADALAGASECRVGKYDDWRMPTIKELYSLIDFNGYVHGGSNPVPFLDSAYFDFKYGDTSKGERVIDCQDWSATTYRGKTMSNNPTAFGVNFADGRIKGYPKISPRGVKKLYVRYVRGNPRYGDNNFHDNHDGTVTDKASSLVWSKADSGKGMNWEGALNYCESLELAGASDWRLPDAKELQSIVDYSRGPATTGVPAVDPVFSVTEPESYFWSSTTHYDGPKDRAESNAAYVAFGRAMGRMHGMEMDVHGAGAQRSDPKAGAPSGSARFRGPQGDEIRVYNYARCVRGGAAVAYIPSASERIPESVAQADGAGQNVNQAGKMRQGSGIGAGVETGTGPAQRLRRRPARMGNMGSDLGSDLEGGAVNGPDLYTILAMGPGGGPGDGTGGAGGAGGRSGRRGPPQEAFDACSGSSSGDSCTVNTPHGELSGTCGESPQGMVCRPEGGRGGMGGRGGQSGQGMNQGGMSGQGQGQGQEQGQGVGQGQGRMGQGPPQEAFDACSGGSSGDTCTMTTPRGEESGICEESPEGMVCRPEGRGGPGGQGRPGQDVGS